MNDDSPVIIDAASGGVETLPPAKNQRYRAKLNTVQDVKGWRLGRIIDLIHLRL